LPMLHRSALKSVVANLAAYSGLGSLALRLKQKQRCSLNASIREVKQWGSWVDDIWERFRTECSFAVDRDLRTVRELYPPDDPRLTIFLVEEAGKAVAWSVCFQAETRNHLHFANLQFATVMDSVASSKDVMPAVAALTYREAARRGADLVVANFSHEAWIHAFRAAGFLGGPSNYQLGMSRKLAEAIARQPEGDSRIHVTRGDGDGRVGLG